MTFTNRVNSTNLFFNKIFKKKKPIQGRKLYIQEKQLPLILLQQKEIHKVCLTCIFNLHTSI